MDLAQGVIRVRRGVVRSRSAGVVAKAPECEVGIRDVPIPPDIIGAAREHKKLHAASGPQGSISTDCNSEHLSLSAFYGKVAKKRRGKSSTRGRGWYEARRVAGREGLRFHHLRHGASPRSLVTAPHSPRLNRALHTIVLVRLRTDEQTRAYAARRKADGKTPREIKRCLKRAVARQVYRHLMEATAAA